MPSGEGLMDVYFEYISIIFNISILGPTQGTIGTLQFST